MVHHGWVRSDASRNAAAILEAARTVVAERGIDAPMAEIARRAGLAVGTLYRHHPTKRDLVAAVVADSVARMTVAAEDALAGVDAGRTSAGTALRALVRDVAAIYAVDRAFKERLGENGAGPSSADGAAQARATAAVAELLDRAQQEGAVRADLTVDDLAVLLSGLPAADGRPREVYLDVVLAGLAPAR